MNIVEQITISVTAEEVLRAKRAAVALMECFKEVMGSNPGPLEFRKDVQALMGLLRKVDQL